MINIEGPAPLRKRLVIGLLWLISLVLTGLAARPAKAQITVPPVTNLMGQCTPGDVFTCASLTRIVDARIAEWHKVRP